MNTELIEIPYRKDSFKSDTRHRTYPELEKVYGGLTKYIEDHLLQQFGLIDGDFYDLLRDFLDDVDDDSNLWYYYPQVGINIKPDKNGITMVELRKILRPIFESPEDFFIGIDSIDEDEKHDFYFDL